MKGFCAVFLLAFALYTAALHPALAPYRDSGEMSIATATLSVAHPTSYPLYVQLGHLCGLIAPGNRAYRLGLLSVLCGALAVAAVFSLFRRRRGTAAGAAAALLLGLNATFWSVAQVQEMYALGVLVAVLLMGLAWSLGEAYAERLWLLFALAYGLFLANRLDLLLWAPGLLWIALGSRTGARGAAYWAGACFLIFPALMAVLGSNAPIAALIVGTALWLCPDPRRPRWALLSAAFAALGLGIYLFLPVRSAGAPFLDWNHPAVLANFLESLLRSRYGGTLDLLSKNYAPGELFGDNLILYARHLWGNFSAVGLAAAAAGCWLSLRRAPRRRLGEAGAWWWSGPVFLFMANLPPNPHAAAIVEPHYLASDLILVFWAAEGVGVVAAQAGRGRLAAWVLCGLLAAVPFRGGLWARMDRRWHLFSYDYAKNVLRCAPPGATLAAKKDVQLYTLWHYQTVQGWRPDVNLIAQGLAGTAWYQADLRRLRPGLFVGPLRDLADWRKLAQLDAPFLATMDCEIPSELAGSVRGRGLLNSWEQFPPALSEGLWALMVRRGRYEYEGQPDFFTSDLVGNYAQARYQAGRDLYAAGAPEAAAGAFQQAWAWQWGFAEPSNFLGYMAFVRGDYAQARRFYSWSVRLNRLTMELAERYRSLPDVKAGVRRSAADALMQLGVVGEKLKDALAAEDAYRRSLELFPSAQVHYNLAVLFWTRDPARAEIELQEALRVDPRHAEAARYLAVLRSRRK